MTRNSQNSPFRGRRGKKDSGEPSDLKRGARKWTWAVHKLTKAASPPGGVMQGEGKKKPTKKKCAKSQKFGGSPGKMRRVAREVQTPLLDTRPPSTQ